MIQTNETDNKRRSLVLSLATLISVTLALAVCFYVSFLSTENRRLAQINRSLLITVEKEKKKSAMLAEEIGRMERRFQDKRKSDALAESSGASYRELFPELNVKSAACYNSIDPKVIYLTFEGAPTVMTDLYLDMFKRLDVKATFFVIGWSDKSSRARIKRMADEGHTVAPHTYTQKYKKIYVSAAEYLYDFKHINDMIVQETGQKPDIFRLPGNNVVLDDEQTYQEIITEMERRGYTCYDWSLASPGRISGLKTEIVEANIINKLESTPHKIVLLDEGNADSLAMREKMIIQLKGQGYRFERLTNKVEPIHLKIAENHAKN